MKNEIIKQIAAQKKHYLNNYTCVGVRVQKSDYNQKVGEILRHNSSVWEDGNELDEQLCGVSAIDINRAHHLDNFGGYSGNMIIVLGSESAAGGNDIAEIILRDATILEIINT